MATYSNMCLDYEKDIEGYVECLENLSELKFEMRLILKIRQV